VRPSSRASQIAPVPPVSSRCRYLTVSVPRSGPPLPAVKLIHAVTAAENVRKDVAHCVKGDGCADAAGPRTQPSEKERRKEDRNPRGLSQRCDMAEGEDGARDEEAGADTCAENSPSRCPDIVEARLKVSPIERFFWQRDDDELAQDLIGRVDGLRRET